MGFSALFRTKSIAQIQKDAAAGLLADAEGHGSGLSRTLGVKDLTLLGVAAIIGAGIFSTIGTAAYNGDLPWLFFYLHCDRLCVCRVVLCRICINDPGGRIGLHICLRQLWRIDRVDHWLGFMMEYAIGNIAVAISWADYFSTWFWVTVSRYRNTTGWIF